MKNRKLLKENAHKSLKNHYFRNVLLVFLASLIIAGGYTYRTNDLLNINKENSKEVISNNLPSPFEFKTPKELIDEFLNIEEKHKTNEEKLQDKYNRGILAVFVNKIYESDSFVYGMLNAFNQLFFRGNISVFITIILTSIILLFLKLFIQNVIVIGKNRYFLEERKYKNTKIDKLLFPFKIKKTIHLAGILFSKYLYQFLWNLTIIGGIIKHYEYLMIPYILAENPNVSLSDAFKLSKEMMNGKKFETFKLDVSLLGWEFLGVITFDLTNIFYYDVYKECILAELYMDLRSNIKNKYPTLLNDTLLDIDGFESCEYPKDKYNVPFRKFRKWLTLDYKKNYSIENYILFFFSFAFIGWIYEVIVHLVQTGEFVNRGAMWGPYLPIYGYGGVLILILLKPFREKPWLLFLSAFILCGLVEYGTALYLETFQHMKWWDYSGYFLNFQGRICLEGLIVFGLAGCSCTYFIAPLLDNLYKKIKPKLKKIIAIFLVLLYICDLVISTISPNTGRGITENLKENFYIIEKDSV